VILIIAYMNSCDSSNAWLLFASRLLILHFMLSKQFLQCLRLVAWMQREGDDNMHQADISCMVVVTLLVYLTLSALLGAVGQDGTTRRCL